MNQTDIDIASSAFVLLGGDGITSFEDGSAQSIIAKQLYTTSYRSLLTRTRWRFATKIVELSKLTKEPIIGYSSVFQLPSDLLYLQRVHNSLNYEIYNKKELHINDNRCFIDYTYEIDSFDLPDYFRTAFEYYLASKFAKPLTGDITITNTYFAMYKKELSGARFADSTQRPSATIVSNPYVNIRG